MLLTRGANLDIFSASALGRIDRVGELLDRDPSLVKARLDDREPLHWAAAGGQKAVVELLLARGATVRGQSDNTPLHAAARRGDEAICRLLIAAGADVTTGTGSGRTPLHDAAEAGHVGVAELLIAQGEAMK